MENEENKKENSDKLEHIIDILHKDTKLPTLRTYQGDMAEYIKDKNESVISVAVKEKQREEKRTTEKNRADAFSKPHQSNFQINFTAIFLSLALLGGGGLAILYVWSFITKPSTTQTIIDTSIIPYNNMVTLANITKESLSGELTKIATNDGVSVAKISNDQGQLLGRMTDFFDLLEIPKTISIRNTLKNEFDVGTFKQKDSVSLFMIISIEDFGRGFASMLEWEPSMLNDLSFLNTDSILSEESFNWKDSIIKNKDVRALINNKGNSQLAYTFLDKNIILITNNISIIADLSAIYASRAVVR